MLVTNRVTSYFDASGGEKHPAIIVAGYIATVRRWERFDTDWRRVLNRKEFDVPYFHMKEFAHSRGEFEDWQGDERRRRRFINALLDVLASCAKAGFACMIKEPVWDSIDKSYPLRETYGCPYALAGRDCVNKAHHWGEARHHYGRNEIKSVFEAGDEGKGHLMRVVEEAGKPVPLFEYGRPKPKLGHLGTPPLQAADFAAWELLKAITSGKESAPLHEYRVSLQRLIRAVPVSWSQYKESDFLQLLALGNIAPRTRGGV